jgi:hypothetical protein
MNSPKLELEALERAENAELTGKRQLWERQPGETEKAFHAFRLYRDLAEKRTLAKVAQTLGCSSTNVERWARRWAWTQRTYEYDLVQEEEWQRQASRDRVAMRRRQIQLGQVLQSIAAYAVRGWQQRIEQQLPLDLRPDEVLSMMKLGSELESRGHGEEKERGKFTRIVVNFSTLTDEKFEQSLKGGQNDGRAMSLEQAKLPEQIEREEYEMLDEEGRRAWEGWKNPPPKQLN